MSNRNGNVAGPKPTRMSHLVRGGQAPVSLSQSNHHLVSSRVMGHYEMAKVVPVSFLTRTYLQVRLMSRAFGAWLGIPLKTSPGLRNTVYGLYLEIFGSFDLHSHIRFRAIKRYLRDCGLTLELGAGSGQMSVECAITTNTRVLAASFSMDEAQRLRRAIEGGAVPAQVECLVADARCPSVKPGCVDQVLLIDVLEHIVEDDRVLESIHNILRPSGRLILSVPTERYVQVFGADFDMHIGHVRHYSIEMLMERLAGHGFDVVAWSYHTKRSASVACYFWYNYLPQLPSALRAGIRVLGLPVLMILAFPDVVGNANDRVASRASCGIALEAMKRLP